MPTKMTGKGLQRVTSRVWYVTNPDKPCPQEHVKKRARPCCAALEKRKRKLGMHVKIYSFELWFCLLTILMDSQVSKSLKQRFLILLLVSPCSASLSLSLSLSLSFRSSDQLQQTVPIIHLFSHSNEKHYKWTRVWLLFCIKALIRIKPYIKS